MSPFPEQPSTENMLQGNAGAALESEDLTWKALLASVAYALILHYVQIAVFVILRPRFARIYLPRTNLVPEPERTQTPPDGVLGWLRPVWSTPDDQIIDKCGLDAFLFLRFMRMMLKIFLPITLAAISILAPINRLSGERSQTISPKELSVSNVAPEHTAARLWVHWTVGAFVATWVCYVIHDETLRYVQMRQGYLRGRGNHSKVSASTILVGNIPKALLTHEKIKGIFDAFPGGVRAVHINKEVKGLSAKISTRQKLVENIEVAETRLIRLCAFNSMKAQTAIEDGKRPTPPRSSQAAILSGANRRLDAGAAWECYARPEEREIQRLPLLNRRWFPSLPMLGKKVDRICHLREELNRLSKEIETLQANAEVSPPTSSAFVQFHRRIAAHLACQSVIDGVPHTMTPRMLDVDPNDVVWVNLGLGGRERWVRTWMALMASAAVIVLYAVPIALTSLLANIDALATSVDWLSWLADWPEVTKSLVQGVLPPALLQLLLLLVPVIYRALVHLQGAPTGTAREVAVQNWHFLFLFVQVFLVVSISGGLIAFLSGAADDPKSVPAELARSLPRAANYFMSYVLVKALTGSATALLQPCVVFVHAVSPMLDVSPRQMWKRQAKLATMEWARLFPPLTNIAVIGIAFSAIAPLVLAFVTFAFALHWLVYRYNVLYVYQYEFDSGGRFFVAAINQLFAGLYVMEVCLIGIFILAIGPDGGSACIPQALAMMAVLLLTVAFQTYLNRTYRALMFYLPVSGEEQAPLVRQSKSIALSTDTGKPDTAGEGQGLHVPSLTMTRARMTGVSGEETSSTEVSVCRPTFHERQADSESQDDDDLAAKLRAQDLAPTIWIPKDTLGVSKGEIDAAVLTVPSVNVSDDGAFMDDGGNVTIETCPPEQGSLSYVKPESDCARNHVV